MSAVPSSALQAIRPMEDGDVEGVMEIEIRAYPFPWTHGIFYDCLRVGYGAWVYDVNDDLRGYTVMSAGAGEAHLLNLCVAPEWQGCGIGHTLLSHVVRKAERLKASRLLLEVRPSNTSALRLYRRMGFEEVGRRRGYYPAERGREDALVLARPLIRR